MDRDRGGMVEEPARQEGVEVTMRRCVYQVVR